MISSYNTFRTCELSSSELKTTYLRRIRIPGQLHQIINIALHIRKIILRRRTPLRRRRRRRPNPLLREEPLPEPLPEIEGRLVQRAVAAAALPEIRVAAAPGVDDGLDSDAEVEIVRVAVGVLHQHDEGELARQARLLQRVLLHGPDQLAVLDAAGRGARGALDLHHLGEDGRGRVAGRGLQGDICRTLGDAERAGEVEGPVQRLLRDDARDEVWRVLDDLGWREAGVAAVGEVDGELDLRGLEPVGHGVGGVHDEAKGQEVNPVVARREAGAEAGGRGTGRPGVVVELLRV